MAQCRAKLAGKPKVLASLEAEWQEDCGSCCQCDALSEDAGSDRETSEEEMAGHKRRSQRRRPRCRLQRPPAPALQSLIRGPLEIHGARARPRRRPKPLRASATRSAAGKQRSSKRSRRSCARPLESVESSISTLTSLRAKLLRPWRSQCQRLHQACRGASAKHGRVTAVSTSSVDRVAKRPSVALRRRCPFRTPHGTCCGQRHA